MRSSSSESPSLPAILPASSPRLPFRITYSVHQLFSPYDILDLPVGATENEIKKQYRKKSLLIHPDKYKHERGLEVGSRSECFPMGSRMTLIARI